MDPYFHKNSKLELGERNKAINGFLNWFGVGNSKKYNMGRSRLHMEAISCEVLRKNVNLYEIFEKRVFTPLFMTMKRYNDKLTSIFFNYYMEGEVALVG